MVITTLLAYVVARESWGVSRARRERLAQLFLLLELGFSRRTCARSRTAAGSRWSSAPWSTSLLPRGSRAARCWRSRFNERMYPFDSS